MKLERRGFNVALTLEPSELEGMANAGLPTITPPAEFWPLARKAVEDWRLDLAVAARAEALAVEAAEACPIKVGQEVRDPKAWRNASVWWRVERVEGTPGSPVLRTRAVRSDGSTGQKEQSFYGRHLEGLQVRDNTEGKPALRPLPGVSLKEVAKRIHAHLAAMEKAQPPDGRPGRRLYNAGAFPAGSRVSVRYVSYQGTAHLTRDEAAEYLIRLDAGFRGRHTDRSEPREAE